MFFDEKSRVFRKLKRILRDLKIAESDLKKKKFENVFKELRIGFRNNKRFIRWLKRHHSEKIDSKNLVYGSEYIDKLLSQVTATLMNIREHFNEKKYSEA